MHTLFCSSVLLFWPHSRSLLSPCARATLRRRWMADAAAAAAAAPRRPRSRVDRDVGRGSARRRRAGQGCAVCVRGHSGARTALLCCRAPGRAETQRSARERLGGAVTVTLLVHAHAHQCAATYVTRCTPWW
ncbi:hypothetical protein BC834DRAFT_408484 [Gloeopeniophorella convolvens]|nr:hypothetical protein BC834DRAFT_408484 [Gloeopeniophorella convolvens]